MGVVDWRRTGDPMSVRIYDDSKRTHGLVPFHNTSLHPRNQAHNQEFSRKSCRLLNVLVIHSKGIKDEVR